MKVLAGDLGGTNARLWIAEVEGNTVRPLREAVYSSPGHPDPTTFLREFLAGEAVESACLAVAGPVEETPHGQTARITNLPWRLDSATLREELALPALTLINDFQAVGHGLDALQSKDLVNLQNGRPRRHAPRALIGAGTGLGVAIMVWNGRRYQVLPTEGGHVDFAPTDPLQTELWRWLHDRYGHVSAERVLSGPGLVNLYHFFRQRENGHAGATLEPLREEETDPAHITEAALWHGNIPARRAVELFIRLYGAQAGNLALTTLPYGGLFLAGGIAPRLIDILHNGEFILAFRNKGRMAPLMERFPVQVIINTQVGLLGAALMAARLAEETA